MARPRKTPAIENDGKTPTRRIVLRSRLIEGNEPPLSDAELLELLLTYAIPTIDLKPLSTILIDTFGSLDGVLNADFQSLTAIKGIKEYSAGLIQTVKAIDQRRSRTTSEKPASSESVIGEIPLPPYQPTPQKEQVKIKYKKPGTGMVSRALIDEAIRIIPNLPKTESLQELNQYLISNLHYNSVTTRERYTRYIAGWLFLEGTIDSTFLRYASLSGESQDLRDVCFYRFCKAYPLTIEIVQELLIPAIGAGLISRDTILDWLLQKFPDKSVKDGLRGILEAFKGAHIIKVGTKNLTLWYREPSLISFSYILYAEFGKGVHNISDVISSPVMKGLFWKPDSIMQTLYELRNQGIISKVSEIDDIRQVTLSKDLDEVLSILFRVK